MKCLLEPFFLSIGQQEKDWINQDWAFSVQGLGINPIQIEGLSEQVSKYLEYSLWNHGIKINQT